MAVVLGLDIGTKTITGVVVSGTPKKFKVVDCFVEEIPDLAANLGSKPTLEEVDLEDDTPVSAGELIRKVVADRGLQNADVVASIESKNCIVRELWVPFTRDDQIEKTLMFEAENSLITFDVDEMVLEYHKVDERDGKSQLLLFAARHATIQSRLDTLKDGGVDPISLDLDSSALFNAYALTPTFDPARNTLLVDIGYSTANVLLVQDGTLKKARTIRMGALLGETRQRQLPSPDEHEEGEMIGGDGRMADFVLPDASSIEARFDEIENALRRLDPLAPSEPLGESGMSILSDEDELSGASLFDLDDDDEPIAILTDDEFDRVSSDDFSESDSDGDLFSDHAGLGAEDGLALEPEQSASAVALAEPEESPDYSLFLQRLGYEIQRTFATNFIRQPLELICFTGGKGLVHETVQFFTEEFDVETIPLEFGDTFEMDLDQGGRVALNRVGGVALGLALKEMGKDRLSIDFRKDAFRYERHFDKLKYPMLLTGILLCALFLQLVFDNIKQYQSWKSRSQQLRARAKNYYTTFWDDLASKGKTGGGFSIATSGLNKELQEVMGGSSSTRFVHDINAFKELQFAFNQARRQQIEFRVETINLNLQTRKARRAPGGSGNRNRGSRGQGPSISANKSTLKLIARDATAGDQLAKIINKSTTIFTATASFNKTGDYYTVMLDLVPKESYLKLIDR